MQSIFYLSDLLTFRIKKKKKKQRLCVVPYSEDTELRLFLFFTRHGEANSINLTRSTRRALGATARFSWYLIFSIPRMHLFSPHVLREKEKRVEIHAKNALLRRILFPRAISRDRRRRHLSIYFPFSSALPHPIRIVESRRKLAQRACNYHQPSECPK